MGHAKWLLVFTFAVFVLVRQSYAYVPPVPTVEPLYPKGLRMYIPDEDGISLVAYHVKINEEFFSLEAGTIAIDIIKTRNGRWLYEDRTTRLKRGDKIYYWIHVVYDGLGYNLLDHHHDVTEFYNYDGTPVTTNTTDSGTCNRLSDTKVIDKDGKELTACPGQLLFEETFDSLMPDRWSIVERFSEAPNYEFVVYKNSNENVETKDGSLHIKPVFTDDKYGPGFSRNGSLSLDKCTGASGYPTCQRDAFGSYILPPIISGRVNTKGSFNFLYGRIEIRAKLPHGDWLYPLLILENENTDAHSETHCELRVGFSLGNGALRSPEGLDISGHLLSAGGLTVTLNHSRDAQQSNRMTLPSKSSENLWSDDYHVYELEWRRSQVVAKVDGQQYGTQATPSLLDAPSYITLGLAAGGHGEFPDMSLSGTYDKPWRNIASKALFRFYTSRNKWMPSWQNTDTGLHVDYVKVWAI